MAVQIGKEDVNHGIIRNLSDISIMPWCLMGDFNDLLSADEKRGGTEQPRYLIDGFNGVVNECGLIDLGFVGEKYTWERSRGKSNWVQERLDRGLANQEWLNLFPAAEVRVLEVATSDHLPIFLQLNKQVYVPKPKRFRFENLWLREKDCLNVVKNSWSIMRGRGIMDKIGMCCTKLEEWGGGLSAEYKQQITTCRSRLRKLRSR